MGRPGLILVIDDDEDFSCLLRAALEELGIANAVETLDDGNLAMDYLGRLVVGPGAKAESLPALVLLDLKLPGKCGREILQWMHRQPGLVGVPVVVFTGMEGPQQKPAALAWGAAGFFVKPASYRELVAQVGRIRETYLQPQELKQAA